MNSDINAPANKKTAVYYYAVAKGTNPGIYGNWPAAQKQVTGYSGNTHQRFTTLQDARDFMVKAGHAKPKLINIKNTDQQSPDISCKSKEILSPARQIKQAIDPDSPSEMQLSTNNTLDDSEVKLNFLETTAQAFSSPVTHQQQLPPEFTCNNCTKLASILQSTLERVEKLESASQQDQLVTRMDKVESLLNLFSTNSKATDFKLAELSAKIDHLTASIGPVTPNNHLSTANVQQSSTTGNQLSSTTDKDLMRHPNPTAENNHASKHYRQNHKASNQHQNQSRESSLHKNNQIQFQPNKCVVIYSSTDNTDTETFRHLNQDSIRRTLSINHGPILIDYINRYGFRSAKPKFIVQLNSQSDAEKIIQQWKPNSFGGSLVRATIDPQDTDKHAAMIRGVPLNISHEDIDNALKQQYPGAHHLRLSKDDQPLRTIKVTFVDNTQLQLAIKQNLLLPSHNMLFRPELPYSTANK